MIYDRARLSEAPAVAAPAEGVAELVAQDALVVDLRSRGFQEYC